MSISEKRKGKSTKNVRTSMRLQYSLDYLFDYYYQAKVSVGRAKSTLKTYQENYQYFCEYLETRGLERDVRNVTTELGREYIIWLRNEKKRFSNKCNVPEHVKTVGLLPKSINTRIKNMKTMFKFLFEEGKINSDPLAPVKCVEDLG
ncbi:phage integrase SAM-like domain-containing protein [Paenibacillus taiwanensis]|uniref:phage integrase SAM-like domain-containing protein n=1 Tax=Paenibacillus taiwanensis TaxID=401638 RepID=UPI000422C505|nr:phage integrase SAM-like domain-containing protein [Paenibacillus taiwanensis]